MTIYTKTGDAGMTSLFGGKRVLKSEALVDAYGSVDELNSWIGVIGAHISQEHLKDLLQKIQADLFTIGGHLSGWKTDLGALPTRVTEMEVEIDAMEKVVPPLTNFILPGGSVAASHVHVARSVTRRVERQVVALSQTQPVDGEILKYFNRLSDLCFMLARFINKQANVEDVIWSGIPRQAEKK